MNKWLKANWLKIISVGITLLIIAVGIIVQFDRYGQDIEDMTADLEDVEDSVKELQLMIERLAVSVGTHSEGLYRIESILLED